jgi:hypothetical protein
MRNGMVNIRPDVDLPPEEVLLGYSTEHADEVLAMSRDAQVRGSRSIRGFSPAHVCHMS